MSDPNVTVESPWSLKLIIGLALGGGLAYFLLPILVSIVLSGVTLLLLGLTGLALWFFFPSIVEGLAQMSYMSYEMAIRRNPVTKLKREVLAFEKDIANMEEAMSAAAASVDSVKALYRSSKSMLTKEEQEEFEEDINFGIQACQRMKEERDQAILECEAFKRTVQSAEAKYKLSVALKKCLGPLAYNKKSGKESDGSQIALDQIQTQLSQSRQKLGLAISRPTSRPKAVEPVAEVAALPAPSTEGLIIPARVNQIPAIKTYLK